MKGIYRACSSSVGRATDGAPVKGTYESFNWHGILHAQIPVPIATPSVHPASCRMIRCQSGLAKVLAEDALPDIQPLLLLSR